ncbi:MAG: hypothetical protein J3R72DRAFT_449967 [Linnemannia gamsii]|nr:MAG: hypothetical protein J3R72DRAFT_449967 [Linnemannia gamsii]
MHRNSFFLREGVLKLRKKGFALFVHHRFLPALSQNLLPFSLSHTHTLSSLTHSFILSFSFRYENRRYYFFCVRGLCRRYTGYVVERKNETESEREREKQEQIKPQGNEWEALPPPPQAQPFNKTFPTTTLTPKSAKQSTHAHKFASSSVTPTQTSTPSTQLSTKPSLQPDPWTISTSSLSSIPRKENWMYPCKRFKMESFLIG